MCHTPSARTVPAAPLRKASGTPHAWEGLTEGPSTRPDTGVVVGGPRRPSPATQAPRDKGQQAWGCTHGHRAQGGPQQLSTPGGGTRKGWPPYLRRVLYTLSWLIILIIAG